MMLTLKQNMLFILITHVTDLVERIKYHLRAMCVGNGRIELKCDHNSLHLKFLEKWASN